MTGFAGGGGGFNGGRAGGSGDNTASGDFGGGGGGGAMGSLGRVGLRSRRGLWPGGLSVLLASALMLWLSAGASAASRIYWDNCALEGGSTPAVSFADLNGNGHGGDLNTGGVDTHCMDGLAMDLKAGNIFWGNTYEGNPFFGSVAFVSLSDSGSGGNLDTTGAFPASPNSVATDPATGMIYWSDVTRRTLRLSFARLNGTGGGGDLSTAGAKDGAPADAIAIDPANGKIYWSNPVNKISFANLNGSGHGGVLNTTGATVDHPGGVAIDPANGRIYWSNPSSNLHPISFANLNGSGHGGNLDVRGAREGGRLEAVGVAVDPEAGRIYWANSVGLDSKISFAKLNDSGGGGEVNTMGATAPNFVNSVALLKLPRATAKPKVSGGSKVGSTLSCSRGRWAPDLVGSFLYQRPVSISYGWSRNGKPITDATTRSITTSRAGAYACTVTATNQAGHTKKTSATRKVT